MAINETTGWQPIETAPKDGTEILIWDGTWVHTTVRVFNDWLGSSGGVPFFDDDGSDREYAPGHLYLAPTHWMPLPEPPK
jgi:hypothetical protein